MTDGRWIFILALLVLEMRISVCAAMNDTEPGILEWISRRQSLDIYKFINSTIGHDTCDNENSTYLISENRCVKDQKLLNGCSHAIVPAQSVHPITIARNIVSSTLQFNVTYLLVADNTINNSAIFRFNETNQLVNSSFCNISSLEVYRGRDQAFEINHNGFSLNSNGNIEINTDQLGYTLEDYVGELYYMNLSCSGGDLPENGCLFFKVIGRSYSITNAKFNSTVPGTLHDFNEDCIITTTVATPTKSTSNSTETTSYITTSNSNIITTDDKALDTDLGVVYLLAGLGGGILILTFCIMTVCICICLQLARRKRKVLSTFTADNVYTMEDNEQPQQLNDGERIRVQENDLPITSRPTVTALSDSVIVSEDTEHVYAALEQTQLQPPTNVAQLNETVLTEQDQQTHLIETEPRNSFQYATNHTGLKSRSATWTSAQLSMVGSKPRHETLELVQIYDNVMIKTEGKTATDTDNGPSYPENYRKHSLPANIGGHQRSNTSQDYSASNESDKNKETDDSMPIYSKPDMTKKREERRRKREQKEQEERMAASQEVSASSFPPLPQQMEISLSRQQENEPSIKTDSGAVVNRQQKTDTDLKFRKNFGEQDNQDDKVPMGKDECVYDEPISLDLVPKKNKNITQRKQKGKDGEGE